MPIEQPVIRARTMRRASKPLDVRVVPLKRTLTARCAHGRRCLRASDRVCMSMKRLTRRLSGLRASRSRDQDVVRVIAVQSGYSGGDCGRNGGSGTPLPHNRPP